MKMMIRVGNFGIKRGSLIFIVLSLYSSSCGGGKVKRLTTDQLAINVEKGVTSDFRNIKCGVLSGTRGDKRILVSSTFRDSLRQFSVALSVTNQGAEILRIIFPKSLEIDSSRILRIGTIFHDFKIKGLEVDSADNIYFSIDDPEEYQYVMIRDKLSLKQEYKYQKSKGNLYEIK